MNANNRDRLALLLVLLLTKLALLWAWGPAELPDSGGYVTYADLILAGQLDNVHLEQSSTPILLFRVVGLPAVIAALKWLGGETWPWLLVAVQMAASLAATWAVHTVARAFGLNRWTSALVALAEATGMPLVLDQSLLTDSLYTSALIGVTCLLALPAVRRTTVGAGRMALAGGLFAVAFLLREATAYLTIGVVPLVVLTAMGGIIERRRAVSALLLTTTFVLPLLGVNLAYREWNRARAGVPLVTTGAQTNMIFARVKAWRHDPSVFDGDTVLDRTARAVIRTGEAAEMFQIVDRLFHDHGMNTLAINDAANAGYVNAWRHHFSAMIRVPLDHMRSNQAQLTIRPVESIRELILWSQHDDGGFGRWRAVREGRWSMAPLVVLDGICKGASVLVFAAFVLLTPWRLLRGGHGDPLVLTAATLWLFYFALLGMYSLVHLETRYMAALVPVSLLVGVANLDWLGRRWKHGRRARTNDI